MATMPAPQHRPTFRRLRCLLKVMHVTASQRSAIFLLRLASMDAVLRAHSAAAVLPLLTTLTSRVARWPSTLR